MKFMENTKINFMKFKSFGFGLSSVLAFGSIILLLLGVNLGTVSYTHLTLPTTPYV